MTARRAARSIELVKPGDPISAERANKIARALNDALINAPTSLDQGAFGEGQNGDLTFSATEDRSKRVEQVVRVYQDGDESSENYVDIAYSTTKVYTINSGELAGYSIVLTGDP